MDNSSAALSVTEASAVTVPVSNTAMTARMQRNEEEEEPTKESGTAHENGNYCSRCCYNYPRLCAFFTGVLIPQLLIIAISYTFGYGLAVLESPTELATNDAILAADAKLLASTTLYTDVICNVPQRCVEIYLQNSTTVDFLKNISDIFDTQDVDVRLPLEIAKSFSMVDGEFSDFTYFFGNRRNLQTVNETNTTVDMVGLLEFLDTCTKELEPVVEKMFSSVATNAASYLSKELTFSWNRCPANNNGNASNPVSGAFVPEGFDAAFLRSLLPSAQAEQYRKSWKADQSRLYLKYLAESGLLPNATDYSVEDLLDRYDAFERSLEEATGREGCRLNLHASVWFWFAVMTTMGYGNQSPVTAGGRALVFTIGFLNILIFGGFIIYAGYIVATIINDFFTRSHLPVLAYSWVACLYWAVLYYAWMLVIAGYYQQWRVARLDDNEFTFANGYWFAYISTTTVGLGDYYLDPEVLTNDDVIVYPLMFLVGFIFLSSFLGQLHDILKSPMKFHNRITERLHQVSEEGKQLAEQKMSERSSAGSPRNEDANDPTNFEDAHEELPSTSVDEESS